MSAAWCQRICVCYDPAPAGGLVWLRHTRPHPVRPAPCAVCPAEREMLLLKLRAPPGPARTEVLQLAQIFRARVTDVSEATLTLCVTGDPGKVGATIEVT